MVGSNIDATLDGVSVSSGHSNKATPTKTQTAVVTRPFCPLLDKLPAEMRNRIYEYVFATEDNGDDTIDLAAQDDPPSKNILRTCRQVHAEAAQLYKKTYQAYWTSKNFFLQAREEDLRACMDTLSVYRGEDLDHINSLVLLVSRPKQGLVEFDLLDKRGGWRFEGPNSRIIPFYVFYKAPGKLSLKMCDGYHVPTLMNGMDGIMPRPPMKQQIELLLSLRRSVTGV